MKTEADQIIEECCRGNTDAQNFLVAFHRFCHAVDDAIDRDNEQFSTRTFITDLHNLLHALTYNPFYQQFGPFLMPFITSACVAWRDSMEWQGSDSEMKRSDSAVLKGYYHEVFYYVAYLIGGIEHAMNVTAKCRSYHHELERKKINGLV